jgi:hypothetical protein
VCTPDGMQASTHGHFPGDDLPKHYAKGVDVSLLIHIQGSQQQLRGRPREQDIHGVSKYFSDDYITASGLSATARRPTCRPPACIVRQCRHNHSLLGGNDNENHANNRNNNNDNNNNNNSDKTGTNSNYDDTIIVMIVIHSNGGSANDYEDTEKIFRIIYR